VLIEKIRRCAYPQFVWDILPFQGYDDSVLRLDHIHPLGHHGESYDLTNHCLSEGALVLLEEQMLWLRSGEPVAGSILQEIRRILLGPS
jgi:hypothetical protein